MGGGKVAGRARWDGQFWGGARQETRPTHTSLRTAPFAKEGATAGVTTYNNDSKAVHGTDDQSSSSTATLEYFEYGGFESLNKIPVARLSDGVLLNLQLLFTFEWQFTIEKRLVHLFSVFLFFESTEKQAEGVEARFRNLCQSL